MIWAGPGPDQAPFIRLTGFTGFHDDPAKNPEAKLYKVLSYDEVLDKELKVMDLAAFTLARDHNVPIRVFNMNKPGCMRAVVMGENVGTLICHTEEIKQIK